MYLFTGHWNSSLIWFLEASDGYDAMTRTALHYYVHDVCSHHAYKRVAARTLKGGALNLKGGGQRVKEGAAPPLCCFGENPAENAWVPKCASLIGHWLL